MKIFKGFKALTIFGKKLHSRYSTAFYIHLRLSSITDANFGTISNIKHTDYRQRDKNTQSEFVKAKNSQVKVTFIFLFLSYR